MSTTASVQLQLVRTTLVRRVEDAVRRLADPSAGTTITAVAGELGVTHRVARDALTRLVRQQRIVRAGRGRYAPPGETGLTPRPANGARRAHGTVIAAARQALAAQPARDWRARDLMASLHDGITRTHAGVILATLEKNGNVERVAPGRYRVIDLSRNAGRRRSSGDAAGTWWSVAFLDDGTRLLRDGAGSLWLARPARVSDAR